MLKLIDIELYSELNYYTYKLLCIYIIYIYTDIFISNNNLNIVISNNINYHLIFRSFIFRYLFRQVNNKSK